MKSISRSLEGLPNLSTTMKTVEDLEPTVLATPETPIMQGNVPLNKTRFSYENIKKLGEGAFGSVYKVRDKQTGKVFALKIINVKDETILKQTQKEVANLIRISQPCHPYLACYYASYYDPVRREFLIEMEYIEGMELQKWVEEFRKTRSDYELYGYLLAILVKLLQALTYVNATGLIHRDIKPANILMSKVGNEYIPKLVDFGIACVYKECPTLRPNVFLNCCYGRAGTPAYIPPETVQSSQNFPVSDMWSLGVTMFALATNRYPFDFQRDDTKDILNTVATTLPLKLRTANYKLNFSVNNMLQKDPLNRITAESLLNFLQK